MADKSNLIICLLGILIVCSVCSVGLAFNKPVLVNVQVDVEQGSDKEYVYNILNEIEKRRWSVTVYFTGEFAMEYPDIVKDIHDKKHQIAVCGWTIGEDLTLLSYQEQLDFINESLTAVRKAINNFHNAYIADFKPQGLKQNEDTFGALQKLSIRSNAGFLASETKTHPYHTDYGFIAIPIATVKVGSEDVPLIDDAVFDSGASVLNYHDYLKKRYDESLVTKEPFTIVVHSSVTGSDKAKLEAFTRFLDHVKQTNGQIVMTDYMTIMANPYMSDLKIFVDPSVDLNKVYSGSDVLISGSYYAHCDCPNYYIRIYGKYPCNISWQPLQGGEVVNKGADVGSHDFSALITIPYSPCNDPNYMLRAVGRACHGDCWPTQDIYEQIYELKLILKNPRKGRIDGIKWIERTDVPGVDRFCPRGGECVELKPGDLVFNMPGLSFIPLFPFWHIGIYVGDGMVIASGPFDGVAEEQIDHFAYNFLGRWRGATTVFGFKKLCPCEENEMRQKIVDVAGSYIGTRYACPWWQLYVGCRQFFNHNPHKGQPLQCAQLAYLVYKSIGYDLRDSCGPIKPISIYNKTKGSIPGSGVLGRDSYSRLVDPPGLEIWPEPTIRKIYPGGIFSENVLVDPAISMVVFALGWENNSSNLLLTIYDPNGVVVSDGNIVHERDEQLKGEYYIIEDPEDGNWTTKVTTVNVPQEGENYTLSSYFASNLNIIPTLEKQWYSPAEDVLISANFTDSGFSISDVNFAVEVYKPDGSISVIALYDDGSHGDVQQNDDMYSCLFNETSTEGTYNIKITANGTVSGSRFNRETYESFYVRRQTAEISSCLNSGSDTSGDGLYDLLGLNVFVNITESGNYRLTASLFDNNQSFIDSVSKETYLDAGWSRRVELDFDGMVICEHGVNGPYRVDVGIYDVNGVQMDYKEGYSTEPYNYNDFQCCGQITGFVTDPNGQPVKNAYLQAGEKGDTILSDDFNDNWLSSTWSRWPGGPRFSFAETNGEIKIDKVSTESGWDTIQYRAPVNQDVEASIRVRTPNLPEGTAFSFFVFKGGPGSQWGGPEWGCYRIFRDDEGYHVSGTFEGQDYWDSGSSVGLFGDEAGNFHIYKIIYEKSKKRMSFFIDDICICMIKDVNFIDFEFQFGPDCWNLGRDADIDIRVDDFLVKEFIGFTPEIKGTAFTDPNGAYAVNRLRPATYEIDVLPLEGANLLRDSAVTVLDAGETEMVNFILDEGGIVSGHVRDTNGVAVSKAYVEASGPGYATATTDANGVYKLTGLASRTYNISVIPTPYANLMEAATTVQAVKGQTRIVDFTLQPAGSIAGRITDANGTPITNVYLFLSGFEMPRYSVDENGRYIISGLHTGTYTINTDAVETEFWDESKTVNVILGQTTTADFVLLKGRAFVKISGYVMNTSGSFLSNVPVDIKNEHNDMSWIEATNEDGYFEFTNVPAGLYEININDEEPKLSEYTEIDFDAENTVNVNEDLVLYFTLWRIGVNMTVNSSRTYINGDTIDVNVTVTNNDIQDLVSWSAFVELEYENGIEEVLDSNVVPINVAVGETKSFTVAIKIPEDNIYSELNLDVEIQKNNYFVNSNIGPLPAIMYQGEWLGGIQVREQAEHYQEDFETGDFSRFNWILSGDADWFITQQEKKSGSYSAQAGEIDDDENSSISVTLDFSSGNVIFYLKVSSEHYWDFLKFYIDGERKAQWSGQVDWTQVSFPVTEGTRIFKWVYEKDFMISEGSDAAWIDDIVFPVPGRSQTVLEDATSVIKKLGSKKSKVKRE